MNYPANTLLSDLFKPRTKVEARERRRPTWRWCWSGRAESVHRAHARCQGAKCSSRQNVCNIMYVYLNIVKWPWAVRRLLCLWHGQGQVQTSRGSRKPQGQGSGDEVPPTARFYKKTYNIRAVCFFSYKSQIRKIMYDLYDTCRYLFVIFVLLCLFIVCSIWKEIGPAPGRFEPSEGTLM